MKAREFLSEKEKEDVVGAIVKAEGGSDGEIRVHIEHECCENEMKRAEEVFNELEMFKTERGTGVLFYVNVGVNKLAVIGDRGINARVSFDFWEGVKVKMIEHFKKGEYANGLCEGILATGEELKKYFPRREDDKEELPNEISFGK